MKKILLLLFMTFTLASRLCAQSGLGNTVRRAAESSAAGGDSRQIFLVGLIVLLIIILVVVLSMMLVMGSDERNSKRMKVLFSTLPFQVGVIDSSGNILLMSGKRMAGNDGDVDVQDSVSHISELPIELQDELQAGMETVLESGKNLVREYESFGTYWRLELLPLPRQLFKSDTIMWLASEETELRRANSQIYQTNQQFQRVLDSIGDAVIVTDFDGNITLLNPVAQKLCGYSQDEVLNKRFDEFFMIGGTKILEQVVFSGKGADFGKDMSLQLKNGRSLIVDGSITPIIEDGNLVVGAVLCFTDITEEQKHQHLLSAQTAIIEATMKMADIVYFSCDDNARLILKSNDFEQHWHLRGGKPLPPGVWLDPEDLPDFLKQADDLRNGRTKAMHATYRSRKKYGGNFYEIHVVPAEGNDSMFSRREYYGIIQDVTGRVREEAEFHDRNTLLKSIIDNLPGYFSLSDPATGKIVMANAALEKFSGYKRAEMGRLSEFEVFRRSGERIDEHRDEPDFEEEVRDASGGRHIFHSYCSPVPQTGGREMRLKMSLDVTHVRKLEDEHSGMTGKIAMLSKSEQTTKRCLTHIYSEHDFNKAVEGMLEIIGRSMPAERCYIYKYTTDDNSTVRKIFEWGSASGAESASDKLVEHAILNNWQWSIRSKQPVAVTDAGELSRNIFNDTVFAGDIRSALGCGIWDGDRLFGFFGMEFSSERKFDDTDFTLLYSAVKLFLMAIERFEQDNLIKDSVSMQKQIVENLSVPVSLCDRNMRIVSTNPRMREMCGKTEDELSGMSCCGGICGQDEPPIWCPAAKVLSDLMPHSCKTEMFGKHLLLSAQPIFDREQKLKYILETAVDITDISRQNDQLQTEVELVQSEGADKLRILEQCRKDLEEPVGNIISVARGLASPAAPQDEKDAIVEKILSESQRLASILGEIRSIKDVSADSAQNEKTSLDLAALFMELQRICHRSFKSAGIEAEFKMPKEARDLSIDYKGLRQILGAIFAFATADRICSNITVSSEYAKDARRLLVSVLCTPCALSVDAISEKPEVGIARSFCERMNGSFLIRKAGDGYSLDFTFEGITLSKASAAPAGGNGIINASSAVREEKTVIIIDDEASNRMILERMFGILKINVRACDSPAAAAEEMKTHLPAAIFTDLWMQGMSGVDLVKQLRRDPRTAEIPVFLVTGDTQLDPEIGNIFAGIIFKPLLLSELKNAITVHLPELLSGQQTDGK